MQCQPQVPEGAAECHVGNVPHHDVLHSHPVLPEGRERHSLCGQYGEGSQEYYHPRAMGKAPGLIGTRVEDPGAPSALVLIRWVSHSSPWSGQGQFWPGGSRVTGLTALLAEGVCDGVLGYLLPLTPIPPCHPALRTGGGPSPAQAGREAS